MGIFVNKKVIELSNVPDEKIRKIVYDEISHNNSYCNWYVCDELKPISEVKNQENILRYPNDNGDYVYEIGDDIVSDFLLENGLKMGEQVIFLCSW